MYNVKDERKKQNVAGIRRLHESARPSSLCATLGTPDSNEEIQQGESEETKARPETQDYAPFFRPRFKRFTLKTGRFSPLTSQLLVGHSLASDFSQKCAESVGVFHLKSVVVPKGLFIKVSEQMKRSTLT